MSTPAIRVTSCDGALWTLTLAGGGQVTFRGVHHFTCVGSLDDEGVFDCFDPEDGENEADEIAVIRRDQKQLQFLWDEEEYARIKQQLGEQNDPLKKVLQDFTGYGAVVSE